MCPSQNIWTLLAGFWKSWLSKHIYFRLYNEAVAESDARRNYEAEVQKVEKQNLKKAGHYISQEILDADLDRKFTFANETMPKLDTQLKIVAQSYQDMVKTLLLQLTVNSDQSLQPRTPQSAHTPHLSIRQKIA